jgi:hypothetical protein
MNSRRPAANRLELTADLMASAAGAVLEQLEHVPPDLAPLVSRLANAVNAYECARDGKTWQEPPDCAGSKCAYWGNCDHGTGGEDCYFPATVRSSIPAVAS